MKVALVYDRVNKWGGAERLLLVLHEMFPNAPLYTSLYNPKTAPWAKVFPKIYTTFLQKIPFSKNRHEILAPLMPLAFESLNFDKYDVVISVTSEAAKGIITKPKTRHICYCLTPTRYLWSHYSSYFSVQFLKIMTTPIVGYLKKWDLVAAQRPDIMIGISTEVKNRIKKYYGRDSEIIYPPVSINRKRTQNVNMKGYYLIVSRLVSYKNVDLAIKVFNKSRKKLVIVGIGSEKQKLALKAKSNIRFTGYVAEGELIGYYTNCKALIYTQEEDFGLSLTEAQSFGKPAIAFKKGGALDIIVENKTGIFFEEQTGKSLSQAIEKFEKMKFDSNIIIRNAKRFSKERFKKEFKKLL